jgi:hypothetical protein
MTKTSRNRVAKIKAHIVRHVNHHRLPWACGISLTFFFLGWFRHSQTLKHWAEFTLAPVAEAFLSKQID